MYVDKDGYFIVVVDWSYYFMILMTLKPGKVLFNF